MGRIVRATTALAKVFDFLLAITLLSLFASVFPDRFRTSLWQEGGSKGWNSDPSYRTYLWANYKEVPPMPMIWDQRSTQYNLCAAVITTVLWFVRLCIQGHTLDVYGAVVSNALYDVILITLWSYGAVIQSSGDLSDPKHIALRPWYLEHQCNEAQPSNRGACAVAKASFGMTIVAICWFSSRFMVTCMYGAYAYGVSLRDEDVSYHDSKKVFSDV